MSFPKVRALHDYTGRSEMELSFKKGDVITVLEIRDGDWWEGELDGKEGFVPARYVEHAPTWFYPASAEDGGHGKANSADAGGDSDTDHDDSEDEERDAPPPPPPAPAGTADSRRQMPTPMRHLPPDRPNLAKAVMMHHTKHKHDVSTSHKAGLHEFQRAVSNVRNKKPQTTPSESELAAVLRRRNEATTLAQMEEAEKERMPELQRRFSQRFRDQS
ncbi:hypothetical protein PTSG_09482 [Salpingoeca rosetta]|uniref:SH3 domain-containing protein n=1 Tax=Salpingoeca rosetta (strain ATCC 50818 / BSB-021) TaxID=946362 RepID=F2UL50_SALR5|nr:uncharacterized protein PTSG_09482 [Salpingoeca rosetta]EGD77849.1 hypothetical protein PTSG_09482 [Salpingoeca rosetta]|eukprot:XP_004989913.1 hypothetical protein PTSG_09482 [Salpingoeca rosetta]